MLRYKGLGWLAARDDVDPTTVSAPFDVSAEGFVNGEGAALLVLESLDHARERGARVYAELVGYGAANDAYDMLVPHPEGRGLERAIKSCLSRSSTAASELDAIFAPANSVPAFDRASAMAIRTICGRSGKRPRITATRSILGHTHAASAALDCIAAVKAINDKQLPAAVNLRNPIEDLDFVTARQQCADISRVMVAAYGFGGHAAAVMLGRPGL
jgi:3-oxoacyl-(acyl-carrier-protein) synthase